MYGTRKKLTRDLKRMFAGEEVLALHVWTIESVKYLGGAHGISENEAEHVLTAIGEIEMTDYQRSGVSQDTFYTLLNSVRAETTFVSVPADLLERVLASAESGIDIEKNIARDDNKHLPANVVRAINDVKLIRKLLGV